MTVDRDSLKTVGLSLLGALLAICSGLTFLLVAYTAVTVGSNDFLYEPAGLRPLVRSLDRDLLNAVPGSFQIDDDGLEFGFRLLSTIDSGEDLRVVYRRVELRDDIYRVVTDNGTELEVTKFGKLPGLVFRTVEGGLKLNWVQKGSGRSMDLALLRFGR